MLSADTLEGMEPGAFSMDEAARLAKESKEGVLSTTIPGLLAAALEPLPERRGGEAGGTVSTIPVAFARKSDDDALFDLRAEMTMMDKLDGMVVGFYALEGENIGCRIFMYEKGKAKPTEAFRCDGAIATMANLVAAALPRIHAWTAKRALSVIDIEIKPAGGLSIRQGASARPSLTTAGSRVFAFETGEFSLIASKKGFEDMPLSVSCPEFYSYRSIPVEMKPLVAKSTAIEGIAGTDDILKWKNEAAFGLGEKKFRSALSRFIIGLPLSVIAAGTYFAVSEAYSRGGASDASLYVSGGAAIVSISLSAGFAVDTALRLVDVLRASR